MVKGNGMFDFILKWVTLAVLVFFTSLANAFEDDFRIALDLSATQTGLTTYKGYQNDIGGNIKLKYANVPVVPFARLVSTNYYYLVETAGNTAYTSEHRDVMGLGVDLFFNKYIRLRYISDYIKKKNEVDPYWQEAYLLIYNQFIDLEKVQVNNYLESAMIPRYSRSKFSTYFKMQVLKQMDISRTNNTSNVFYPFAQIKIRENDEDVFGVSGSQSSLGLGYKFYQKQSPKSALALLVEGTSIVHQSSEFNADWTQLLAVLQYNYN